MYELKYVNLTTHNMSIKYTSAIFTVWSFYGIYIVF